MKYNLRRLSLSESTEAASFFVDSRSWLHLLSSGWCTLPHLSYATLPRYCRNYALKIYDARRNRRNAPSVARFSLNCHPWQFISAYRVHNSTVSKQLRYALMRESVHLPVSGDEAPHAVPKYSPGDYFFEKYDLNAINRLKFG